jgi:hypothetical protein
MRDVEIKKIHEALKNSLASARVESNKWLRTHKHTHTHTHADIVPLSTVLSQEQFILHTLAVEPYTSRL